MAASEAPQTLVLVSAMSRSFKKHPVTGITTARSEAFDKARWHRAMRQAERVRLRRDPDSLPFDYRQFSDDYGMAKDGKRRWDKGDDFYPRCMRK